MMAIKQQIPDEYWDGNRARWNTHEFFNTTNHWHISDYGDDESCDITVVECKDGGFYIEDNWGGDAQGHEDVFNPFLRDDFPKFFDNFSAANEAAAKAVASITGSDYKELMIEED